MTIAAIRALLAAFVILAVLAIGAVLLLQRSLIYLRDAARAGALAAPPAGAEVLWIDTPAGKVEAWFFRVNGARAPLAIVAHGNAELIDDYVEIARQYNRIGIHALLVEYRGYGRSAGKPSQAAIVADFVAARDLLAKRSYVDVSRSVYHGLSLGGAVVVALAQRFPPSAMVLEETFTSIADMAPRGIPSLLLLDRFDSLKTIRGLECPVLVFHGTRDTVVPIAQGRALAAAARNARFIELDCGHNDFPVTSPEVWREIETLVLDRTR